MVSKAGPWQHHHDYQNICHWKRATRLFWCCDLPGMLTELQCVFIPIFFWANLSKRGKVQWGQLCVKHQPAKQGHTTAPRTPCPTLYDKYVSSLTSPTHHMKMQETGPTIYHPYPRRLEHLTICRCHSKGSMFSSVILRPWVLVRSEARTRHFPHGSPALYNWANRSVCKALMPRRRLN